MNYKVSLIVILCSAVGFASSLDECDAAVDRLNQQLNAPARRSSIPNPANGPNPGQTSLMIAFDSTASMGDDLAQLRAAALEIVDDFYARADNPIYNYILTFFNDPCEQLCS